MADDTTVGRAADSARSQDDSGTVGRRDALKKAALAAVWPPGRRRRYRS